MILGAHMSIKNGYAGAFTEAHRVGGNALQLFAKSPMMARLKEISREEEVAVSINPARAHILFTCIHASYLLNFAKELEPASYQYKSLAEDLRSADKIGAEGVVVHLGKALGENAETAQLRYAENIARIIDLTAGTKAKVILENTAGQGTEMGYRFPEWALVFEKIRNLANEPERVSLCLDTAHAFAGGYDLSSRKGVESVVTAFSQEFDWKSLSVIHLNDSKKPLGSRVDRHQDIGHGTMKSGLKDFVKLVTESAQRDLPFILETPEEHSTFQEQIKAVHRW